MIINPNISWHGNSFDFSLSDKKQLLEGRSGETTDVEHGAALHTSLHSTGVDTAAAAQQSPSAAWQRTGRQAGLLLHLQDGTSRPAVLSTTDVAVLCRSILKTMEKHGLEMSTFTFRNVIFVLIQGAEGSGVTQPQPWLCGGCFSSDRTHASVTQ